MKVTVRLYGILRDRVTHAQQGRIVLEMESGATVSDVVARLGLPGSQQISVNGELTRDFERELEDGDRVEMFRSAAGG